MKQTRPPADGLIHPEEVQSTQNLTALVAPFIVDREHQDQVNEPHDEKAGVRAEDAATNGHRPYKVKYGKYGELVLKSKDGSWVRVIPRAAAVENRRNEDYGWTMRERDKPSFPRSPGTEPLLWRPLGPKQKFFVEHAKLTALKRAAENTAPTTGTSEIQNLILDLERKEAERKKLARRASRQKRPPKAERMNKKPRNKQEPKKKSGGDEGKKGKNKKRGR